MVWIPPGRLCRVSEGEPARIIAMTADAMEGDKEKCLAAGMDDYVSKPINLATMQASIERWGRSLRGSQSQR